MKKLDRVLLIGLVLLIIGVIWALTMKGIGMTEWLMLISGTILGIIAGMIQRWALIRKKQRKIGSGQMILWVAGAIIILVVFKVLLNVWIPSYLTTNENGTYLSIIFAIGGLFLGRSFYPQLSGYKERG